MNYIQATCKTYLDDYDCRHITSFVAVPRVGEYVWVLYKGKACPLRVVSVTHSMSTVNIPYIIVELHN